MWADLRLAARLPIKMPLFTVGVIALLAVGMAANTIIFSLVDALLLRPLPVRDPERLVRLVTKRPPLLPRSDFLIEEYEAWKNRVPGFEDLFAWSEHDMFAATGEITERARVHFVTDNYFSALGTTPLLGRLLLPGDQKLSAGTAPVVLSYTYWKRRFDGDARIAGRVIALDGNKVLIVGVTPKGFNGMSVETGPDLRVPVGWLRSIRPNLYENKINCEVVGRLRAGSSRAAVRQEAESIWRNRWKELNPTDPGLPEGFDLERVDRGISRLRVQFTGALWLVMGGAALLMLMVCANIAGLLMARTASRQGELAVRVALGATRIQLARQLFCESLVLILGGLAGANALTWILLPFVSNALPPMRDFAAVRLPLSLEITPDWRVPGFAFGLSVVTVLLFGLIPALMAARRDLHPPLKESRAGGGWHGRQMPIVVQVALCTVLLAGAGLTIQTLERLTSMNAGFEASHVVTMSVDPDMAKYDAKQATDLKVRLLKSARELPEVESAAISSRGLMRGTGLKMTLARIGEAAGAGDFLNTSIHGVSPEYFSTMRIAWIGGHNFWGLEDPAQGPKPVIVNEAFVRRFAKGQDVIGLKFGSVSMNGELAKPKIVVIGVVGDTKYRSLREPFQPIVYQLPSAGDRFIVHLRTRSVPESVIAPMRKILAGLEPRLSYVEVSTLPDEVAASLWAERVTAVLATGFAAAAAVIVAAGLYALVAFSVTQRRTEIGIRMALGALPRKIAGIFFVRAACLSAAGISIGLLCTFAISPQISSILYAVNPRSWTVLLTSAIVVFFVSVAASLIPAIRAARLHPAIILRQI